MNEIRTLLHLASTRLELSRFLSKAHLTLLVAGGLALALMLADRAGATPFVPWVWAGPALAALGLGAAALLWMRRRMSELHVAIAVDERLDLREKLSTALHCGGRDDVFARAAVEDAVAIARDAKTRERARRLIKVEGPRGWWIAPVIVLGTIAAWWLPQMNLFASDDPAQDPQVQQAKLEAQQSLESLVELIKKDEALEASMSDLLGELTKDPLAGDEMKNASEIRREAIKKVSDLNDRLEEILKGEQAATANAMQQSLRELNTSQQEDGPAKDLAKALQGGDFQAAKDALKELAKQMENGQLNEEQMKKLGEQMQNIADQLNALAEKQAALEQALKQAGLDPQLAKNPQALQQALQNNQNLNQQQKQQLQQQAQAQQAACKMCQGLGQMCQGMGEAMKQGNGQQAGQQAQGLGQQLDKMEAMQQMLQMAQAAANSCKNGAGQMGQSLGLNQQQMQMISQLGGGGMDGRLEGGMGGDKTRQRTPTGAKMQHDVGKDSGDGDVIFRQFIEGDHITGTSTAKLKAAVATATEGLKQGVDEDQIPRKYEEAHKHYFGELEKKIKAEEAKRPAPAPATGNLSRPLQRPVPPPGAQRKVVRPRARAN